MKPWNRTSLAVMLFGISLWAGCRAEPAEQFRLSDAVLDLPPELQFEVRAELLRLTGSREEPKLLGDDAMALSHLKHGQAVYEEQCAQCHGVTGDGAGPVADQLYPRPRDYRRGIFKFTSTRYGSKPLREDLVDTVRRGVHGTAMPKFNLLPEQDVQAVVDYVLMLTHRGELEEQLAVQADFDGAVEREVVDGELVPLVLERWDTAREQVIEPATPQPEFTEEHVRLGKVAFLEKGCSKCHGDDGRAQTAEDPTKEDAWSQQTRPADLTSGMLRGGQRPIDVYRRIYGGINGTPMPAFEQLLKDEPETVWNMTAYVLHVAGRRREGEAPAPGYLRPYLSEAAPAAVE